MNITIVIALLLSVVILVDSNQYWDSKRPFCGSMLADELKVICKGNLYNEPTRKLTKRGIVDECCKKVCSRQFLKTNYCPSPKVDAVKPTTEKPINTLKEKVDHVSYLFEQRWNFLTYVLRKY